MSGCEHTVSPYSARIVTVDDAPYACIFCEMGRLRSTLAAQVAANEELRAELAKLKDAYAAEWCQGGAATVAEMKDTIATLRSTVARLEAERDEARAICDMASEALGRAQRIAQAWSDWSDEVSPPTDPDNHSEANQMADISEALRQLTIVAGRIDAMIPGVRDPWSKIADVVDAERKLRAACSSHLSSIADLTRRLAEVEAERDALKQARHDSSVAAIQQAERDREQQSGLAKRIERETAEAIAAWLDGKAEYYSQNRNIGPYSSDLAASIRSGSWRPTTGREPIAALIKRSSIGAALDDINERGIDAHLADLDKEKRR